MSFDILREARLSLKKLARRENVNPSTPWRWVLHGCRGVILESALIGGKRVTSEEAFERFVARLNAPPHIGQVSPRTATQRQRAVDQAKAELSKAGI